jgi:hypothetical protein
MPTSRSLSLLPGAYLLLAFGCGASVPALDADVFPVLPTSDDNCGPVVTPIEHGDETTTLGFSAIDALSRLAGPRSSPLYWRPPPENQEYLLTYGSEQGLSTLALDVRQGDGPILHRFRAPLLGAPDDTTCDSGALHIPVIIALESASQGLAESFDAVLEVREPYRGHLSKSLEPGALRGSLGLAHVVSLDPERSFWLGPIQFEADIWQDGSVGSLSVHVGASHAQESKELRPPPPDPEQPGPLAAWPSLSSCESAAVALPTSAKVLGFSVDDVLEQLRAGAPRTLTWSDGSMTAVRLELGAEKPELCQEVEERLRFRALLRARSDDGSLDLRLPVQVDALDVGGSIGDISVENVDPEVPYPLERSAGAGASFDAQGYRAVLVGLEWSIAGGRDTGWLSLRGVDATQPNASGSYPSTELTSVRW